MKDGVIKNDGTSRRIYANLPATYEDFRMAAAQGDVLADVLFNADGWQQQPDFLNKRNLLQDVTAGLFGLGTDAVPDDVLQKLAGAAFDSGGTITDVNGNPLGVRIATGSYVGTGKYGESNPNSLTFEFAPKFILLFSDYAGGNSRAAHEFVMMVGGVSIPAIPQDYNNIPGANWTITWLGNTVSWYSTDSALAQANSSEDYNKNYVYFAIG